jgi:uncharacterized protein (TIGR00730 family)
LGRERIVDTDRAMKRVCVFCGSSPGAQEEYAVLAERMGTVLAQRNVDLVYGGGNVGLMGILADAALANGAHVIGVIPQALVDLEVAHTGLPDLRIVGSMHERKALMADLADAFIALPGGLGTLEELCEILTWAQLGLHQKPCGLVNAAGYFDHLMAFLDHAVDERFLRREHRAMILVEAEPARLISRLEQYAAPQLGKWIDREET